MVDARPSARRQISLRRWAILSQNRMLLTHCRIRQPRVNRWSQSQRRTVNRHGTTDHDTNASPRPTLDGTQDRALLLPWRVPRLSRQNRDCPAHRGGHQGATPATGAAAIGFRCPAAAATRAASKSAMLMLAFSALNPESNRTGSGSNVVWSTRISVAQPRSDPAHISRIAGAPKLLRVRHIPSKPMPARAAAISASGRSAEQQPAFAQMYWNPGSLLMPRPKSNVTSRGWSLGLR